MNKILATLFLFCAIAQFTIAQNSSLTVFSQEGERFYVVLDGVRQNDMPMTNVKITDLDRPNYKVKVIFDDASIEDINKNVFLQDVDGNPVEVVYNIRPNKKGIMDMRISSFNEVQTSSSNEENVVKYHAVENPLPAQSSKTVTTTTTVTSPSTTTKESVNVNMGGFGTGVNATVTEEGENVNINMNIGGFGTNMGATTTTKQVTTTTTTSSPTSRSTVVSEPVEKGCVFAMSSSDFSAAKASVNKQSFSDSKMKTAKQFTKANCLSVNQIKEIMNIFSFDDDKLEYAKYAYDYCVDKNKYFMLAEVFSFSSNADELNDYIDGK